jgi:hypothetical protein
MFALKPARKLQTTRIAVILSVASRFLRLPEIVPLRFPVGTRSRRISRRFHLTSKAATADFLAKPTGICTYTNRKPNTFKISTYKISRLKTVQNQHLQKNLRARLFRYVMFQRRLALCSEGTLRRAARSLRNSGRTKMRARALRDLSIFRMNTYAKKGVRGAALQRHAINP